MIWADLFSNLGWFVEKFATITDQTRLTGWAVRLLDMI